jgi:hypothetical protein
LYPRVERSEMFSVIPLYLTRWLNVSVVRDISAHIARAVIQAAQREVSSDFQRTSHVLCSTENYREWIVTSLCEAWATLTFSIWSKRRCGRLCDHQYILEDRCHMCKAKTWIPVDFRFLFLLQFHVVLIMLLCSAIYKWL